MILQNDIDFKKIDNIWDEFHNKFDGTTRWKDLDKKTQSICLEHKVKFLGQHETVRECLERVEGSEREIILNLLTPSIIHEFLQSEVTVLADIEVPVVPPYYIPRLIIPRTRLNPNIFVDACADIFCIDNISLPEMYELVNGERAEVSSKQLKNLTVRFIVLEDHDHFSHFTRTKEGPPIHFIQKTDDQFIWKKTIGSLQTIQEYIHTDQEIISEEDFTSNVSEDQVICFADEPGMGKSLLLANMYMQHLNAKRGNILLYLEFHKLLKICDEFDANINILCKIADYVSKNAFGKSLLLHIISSEASHVKLMLDGFDEVPFEKLKAANQVLTKILKDHPNTQIYCSTRLHCRDVLESTICQLSYNIKPFGDSDQMNFFCGFWYHMFQIETTDALKDFAQHVIINARKTLGDKNENIIGFPLQCSVLAEIYKDDASTYSRHKPSNFEGNIDELTICDMYRKLEETRMASRSFNERTHLKHLHGLAAITLIFSDVSIPGHIFERNLDQTDILKINRLGFMYTKKTSSPVTVSDFRFAHRTFAEYFLGRYLVDCMFGPLYLPEFFTIGLLQKILQYSQSVTNARINTFGKYSNLFGNF